MAREPMQPLPPEALRERVTGTKDVEWFDLSGRRTLEEWRRALGCCGASFEEAEVVMDFGCGCGRVARHLKPSLQAHQTLLCGDVDQEAVAWIDLNYQGIHTVRLPLDAPSAIPDDHVDLIVSQSVFTHLPEPVQLGWLADCARVLKSGGVFLTSVHGPKVVNEYYRQLLDLGQRDAAYDLLRTYSGLGFYYVKGRTDAEMSLPDYYGAAFHAVSYVERVWLGRFALLAYLPVASLGHQDIVVLRKI